MPTHQSPWHRTRWWRVVFTVLISAIALFTAACEDRTPPGKQLDIVYINWTEGVAMTNLVAVLLEERLGYEVDLTMADVAPAYTSLAAGSQDLFLDAWLPNTHAPYWDRYGDRLTDLGPMFEGARIGLVVPDDAPAQSIEDLNGDPDTYDEKIIGIDAGAGIMRRTEEALKVYALADYELIAASEPAMTASLRKAVDKQRPIVVTGWRPHWMFARWQLRFLDDPKGVYGDVENIHAVARRGFEQDHTDAAMLVQRMRFTEEQLASLIDLMRAPGTAPEDAARLWIRANRAAVDGWFAAVATQPGATQPNATQAGGTRPSETRPATAPSR